MPHFGVPGIGGSLGQCAFCGNTFLTEIITGENCIPFECDGIDGTLYAHTKCMESSRETKDWRKLPDGPLRKAYDKAFGFKEAGVSERGGGGTTMRNWQISPVETYEQWIDRMRRETRAELNSASELDKDASKRIPLRHGRKEAETT